MQSQKREMTELGRKTKASMPFCKQMLFHTGTATPGLFKTSEAKSGEQRAVNVAWPCSLPCQVPPSFCSCLLPPLQFCLDVTFLPHTSVTPVTYAAGKGKCKSHTGSGRAGAVMCQALAPGPL